MFQKCVILNDYKTGAKLKVTDKEFQKCVILNDYKTILTVNNKNAEFQKCVILNDYKTQERPATPPYPVLEVCYFE